MIPSATVPSNRTIAPWLQVRLEEVAKHHGGLVPLHGRLFAQWLHYAYPRECQFPHIAGAINPRRPEDLLLGSNVTSEELSASAEVMQQHIEAAPARKLRDPGAEGDVQEESGMWSLDEEMVVWRHVEQPSTGTTSKHIALSAAVLSFAIALVRRIELALRHQRHELADKYFV